MSRQQASHVDRRIGQRLMVGFDGTDLNDQLKQYIRDIHIGGIILFSRNVKSPEQLTSLCASAQAYAAECGLPPLFISIDQEGGQVARLKPPFTQFDGAAKMRGLDDAVAFARTTARELKQVGINMNMAPVLDVLPEHGPSIMEQRAFGRDPRYVADMGAAVVEHLQNNDIIAVAKHYPGIGRTVLDSHEDLPDLDLDPDIMRQTDLLPFAHVIRKQVGGIMLSHIRYRQLDENWPASLSPSIVGDLLRGEMGFKGLVLTDDLDMGAVAKHYAFADTVRQCLAAQVDILLICHPGPKIEATAKEISALCRGSEDLSEKSAQSLERIALLKHRYLA